MKTFFKLLGFIVLINCFFLIPSYAVEGYENTLVTNLSTVGFEGEVIRSINEQRESRGLRALVPYEVAYQSAMIHSKFLIKLGQLSYYNEKIQGPDERYTLFGGQGYTQEIIKGFESESPIKLSPLLANQLVDAVVLNIDDSKVLLDTMLTHVGVGVSLSGDLKKFIVVIEFVSIGGEIISSHDVMLGQKIKVSGRVLNPYRFKAITVAYDDTDENDISSNRNLNFINNDTLKPYIPPIDYEAYIDSTSNDWGNVLKGLLFVGSIAAAPFTAGASGIFAPFILQSFGGGGVREVPTMGGIKSTSGGFEGIIDLNYKNKPGLYFVNLWGSLPNGGYPVLLSRKTVRVI